MPINAANKANLEVRPSSGVILSGLAFRTIFIIVVAVLTARVASPQVEKLRSVLETPSDFIRVALGFALSTWCVFNVFILPKDLGAYRTWMYLGVTVLPLSFLCAFAVW